MFEEFGINAGYVEELHARYTQSPLSVEPSWRDFFEGKPTQVAQADLPAAPRTSGAPHVNGSGGSNGGASGAATNGVAKSGVASAGASHATNGTPTGEGRTESLLAAAAMQGRVYQLINAYRVRGHLFADVDPLGTPLEAPAELDLANFGLGLGDLDKPFGTAGMSGLPERATLRQIIAHLSETYCASIGVEFTVIEEPEPRRWLEETMETTRNHASLDRDGLLRILTKLTDAEIFEQFIHKNYVGTKRFSLEGAESMIPMMDLLIESAGQHGIEEIVIGMAHRGRLNVLVNNMQKDVRELFAAFDDKKPERFLGGGDVKYHLGYSKDVVTGSGAQVHLSLAFNPSHLEWVNPVVEGRVRAKIDRRKRKSTMPLLIHGDAAFMGQGVVPETLNLAGLEGYSTGGTIHLVVNNQIGFTTMPKDSRSTRYCTDITRMLRVPVFHVNGEDPEAVIQVTRLAIEFRENFHQDVVIDMYCYRKYGHNEADEPRFTQPLMYALIDIKPTVLEAYVQRLVEAGHVTRAEADAIARDRKAKLEAALAEARKGDFHQMPEAMGGVWTGYLGGLDRAVPEVKTGVPRATLLDLLEKTTKIPEGFHANSKARKILELRLERAKTDQLLDWGTAEQLAYASILAEGRGIRLSGQDARRGTFSHRHAVLFDAKTGESYTPLSHLGQGSGRFEVYDSPLSEAGVLGFEYGYSLDRPDKLVLWEAQFGDFANSAQVIIDQFITSAEDKWMRLSGLVMLLPHGYEGMGPEHSSARVERFLQMCAEDNIQVCNLTTPAQFFHVLRRQMLRPLRKPLIVFTPKSLLRVALSKLDDMATGTFQRVIGDPNVVPSEVRKILLCTGKVYYSLLKAQQERGKKDYAIIRLEQLYPLNDSLAAALDPYAPGTPIVWVQEEPRNMGGWYFVNARVREYIGDRHTLTLASRAESASPATGSHASSELEEHMLLDAAFAD